MRQNLRPPEGAIGISRQKGDSVRNISLASQENLERRILHRNDGASFGVVTDALAASEPSFGRRDRACTDGLVGKCGNEIGHVRSPALSVSTTPLPNSLLTSGRNKNKTRPRA